MTIAGQLEIQLMADIARLKSDMDKALSVVNVTARGFESAASTMKGALAGIAAGFSVAALTSFVRSVADAGERLHDLSQVTGASVESLSALGAVGKLTGTSVENIADMMTKLARNMAGAREEGKGTGAALRSLGIDFDSFRRLKPEEQMQAVARALDQFADGSGKAAATQAIFGRGAAAQIPFLKELATTQGLAAKITTEQAAAADRLNDNIVKIRASQEGWKKEVAAGLLPVLGDASEALLGVLNKTSGVRDKTRELQKDGSLSKWADDSVTSLSYLLDGLQWVSRAFAQTGQFAGALMAGGANFVQTFANVTLLLKKGEVSAAWAEMNKGAERQAAISEGFLDWSKRTMGEDTLGAMFRKRLAEVRELRAAQQEAEKPQVDFTNEAEDEGKKKTAVDAQANAYRDLIARIRERIDANTLEATSARELTESEKARLEIDKLVREGKLKAADASNDYTKFLLAELEASRKANDEARTSRKLAEENGKATEKKIEDSQKSADKLREEARTLRDQTATLGLEHAALVDLEAARLRDMALRKEVRADTEALIDPTSGVAEALREEAKALRDVADARQAKAQREQVVKDEQEALKQTRELWQSIDKTAHDVFVNVFEDGAGTFKRLGQTLKAALLDMLYQLTVKQWVINIGAQFGGIGGSVASGLAGNAGASMVGGALGLGGMFGAGGMIDTGLGALGLGSGIGGAALGVGEAAATAEATAAMLSGAGATAAEAAAASAALEGSMVATGAGTFGALGAIGTAMPWIGAGLLVASMLDSSHGGPKTESGYGSGVPLRGDPSSSRAIAQQMQAQYAALASAGGGSVGALDLGVFSATDPQGTALTQLAVNASLNGRSLYSREGRLGGIENVGRSEQDLQAAVAEETARVVLRALQDSRLTGAIGDYLRQLGDIDTLSGGAVSQSLAKVQKALTERAALEARLYDMTTSALQKVTDARQKEREALDETNRALYDRVTAIEDDLARVAQTASAAQEARSSLLDSYNSEASALRDAISTHRDYAKQLRDTSRALSLNLAGGAAQTTAMAGQQFNAAFVRALAGDKSALASLSGLGTDYAQAARDSTGTRLDYLRAVASVQGSLDTAATAADAQADIAQQQLDAMTQTVDSLGLLNDRVQTFGAALLAYMQAQDATLAAVQQLEADKQAAAAAKAAEAAAAAIAPTSGGPISSAVDALGAVGAVADASGARNIITRMLARIRSAGIPQFADGGIASGWAIVGEQGPELARFDTPARIYSAAESAPMLAGSEVAEELRAVRALTAELLDAMRASTTHNYKTAKAMDDIASRGVQVRNPDDGTALEVHTV